MKISILFIAFLFLQDHSNQKKEFTTLVYPPERHAPIHKATSVHLFGLMALIGRTDVTPDDPQGMAVTRLTATDDPKDRNDDDDLTAYGLNTGQNNLIYNIGMQGLDVYEGKRPKERLKHPLGVACNSQGTVYVADTDNHRIVKLKYSGGVLSFAHSFGNKGERASEFQSPAGVALDVQNKIYIADRDNDRVQVFDSNETLLYTFGDKEDTLFTKLYKPSSIALLDSADIYNYYRTAFLIVIDLDQSRIQKFTLRGEFLGGVQSADYGFSKVKLTSAAIDYYGNIWITDALNHCVHKFTKDLIYITSFGQFGNGENQFIEPRAIAIWKRFGQVFIADKISAQYYHVGTDLLNVTITQADTSIYFDFLLTEDSKITARIMDENNQFVATLASNHTLPIGHRILVWNRHRSEDLTKVNFFMNMKKLKGDSTVVSYPTMPSGLYKIVIEAKTTYGYSRYFAKKLEIEFTY